MAINACTLHGFTLHGRNCRDKFATLVPILHPPVVAVAGGQPRGTIEQFARFEYEDRVPFTFEQPQITVKVEFCGDEGMETQENTQRLDFVVVTNLETVSMAGPSVMVSDLRFDVTPVNKTDKEDQQ